MPDIQTNLDRFFQNGKTLILPIDHGNPLPVPDMPPPAQLIADLNPHVDGYVVNYGMAKRFAKDIGDKGICLRTDLYKPAAEGQEDTGTCAVYDAEDADEIGAHAMMNMAYLHHSHEAAMLEDCAHLASGGHELGIPLIIEALPYGLGQGQHYTAENIAFAARQAAEIGADVVKTAFPTGATADDFAKVVDQCFVPVIILGGAAMGDDKALLTMVADAISAGAVGVAIGRNVWQHPQPAKIARSMAAIIHQNATAEDALGLMKD